MREPHQAGYQPRTFSNLNTRGGYDMAVARRVPGHSSQTLF